MGRWSKDWLHAAMCGKTLQQYQRDRALMETFRQQSDLIAAHEKRLARLENKTPEPPTSASDKTPPKLS